MRPLHLLRPWSRVSDGTTCSVRLDSNNPPHDKDTISPKPPPHSERSAINNPGGTGSEGLLRGGGMVYLEYHDFYLTDNPAVTITINPHMQLWGGRT